MNLLAAILGLLLAQTSPLISFQAQSELKERIAPRVVEVEVVLRVAPGADPAIAPRLVGQAVCLQDLHGRRHIITSAFLVQNSHQLRLRSRQTPDWVTALAVRYDPYRGFVDLQPVKGARFACELVPLAPPELEQPASLVFSIDNPVQYTNIFHGILPGRGDPPLAEYLIAVTGLPLGGPLFSTRGELVTLNLRRYTPSAAHFLSASGTMIMRWLTGSRRAPLRGETRRRRRSLDLRAGPQIELQETHRK